MLTYAYANRIINHFERGVAQPAVTPRVALFKADPTRNGTMTSEVTGGGYARQLLGATLPDQGRAENAGAITFSNMPECVVTHVGIVGEDGVLLRYGPLPESRAIPAGENSTFSPGDLDVVFN